MKLQSSATWLVSLSALLVVTAGSTVGVASPASPTAQSPAGRPPAASAAAGRIPIFVSHTGQDAVGVALVDAVKDALRRAPTATLAASADEAEVVLLVSTLNPDTGKTATVTTAGWTLLLMKEATKAYIAGGLRMCDPGSVPKTAADLVTHVESVLAARSAEIPSTPAFAKVRAAWDEAVEQAAHQLPDEACGVKVKAAFVEQMQVYFKWAAAAGLVPDVRQAIAAGLSYFSVNQDLARQSQAEAMRLSQCQAELAELKKTPAAVKKTPGAVKK